MLSTYSRRRVCLFSCSAVVRCARPSKRVGGRAVVFFEQFGIEPVTGASGTVRHSLERYLGGQLRGVEPCAESTVSGNRGYAESQAGSGVRSMPSDSMAR